MAEDEIDQITFESVDYWEEYERHSLQSKRDWRTMNYQDDAGLQAALDLLSEQPVTDFLIPQNQVLQPNTHSAIYPLSPLITGFSLTLLPSF